MPRLSSQQQTASRRTPVESLARSHLTRAFRYHGGPKNKEQNAIF